MYNILFFLLLATSMVDLHRFRVFMKKISYRTSLKRSELIRIGPVPVMSETGPRLFFEPVSCKPEEGLVWGEVSSRAALTSYRSHVITPK